jgi:hypothetical protein
MPFGNHHVVVSAGHDPSLSYGGRLGGRKAILTKFNLGGQQQRDTKKGHVSH